MSPTVLLVKKSQHDPKQLTNWCHLNAQDTWYWLSEGKFLRFWFVSPEDAQAFKSRFGIL